MTRVDKLGIVLTNKSRQKVILMVNKIDENEPAIERIIEYHDSNASQRLFVKFIFAVLINLTVLNLFVEYWGLVIIDSFTITFLSAILLQSLLKLSLKAEHYVSAYFKSKEGTKAIVLRWLSVYGILFGAKIIMLEAINLLFGEKVQFLGPLGGLVSFLAVIFMIVIVEVVIIKIYLALGDKKESSEK